MTVANEQELVVFLIGMRVNNVWKVQKWAPVAAAMGRMLKELNEHPEMGFLGVESPEDKHYLLDKWGTGHYTVAIFR